MRMPTILTVLSGRFTSQPLAFAALVDAAEERGLSVDLADIDVIRSAPEVRLAHYFRPQIVARIERLRGSDDTLLVLRPSALTIDPAFPPQDCRLRRLGRFAGEVVDPLGPGDWV